MIWSKSSREISARSFTTKDENPRDASVYFMLINNNLVGQKNLEFGLQHDINALNQQFLDWKRLLSQLPGPNALPIHPLSTDILRSLDRIHFSIHEFYRYFERELAQVQQKQRQLGNTARGGLNDGRVNGEQDRFEVVNQKISMLEASLKQTQESEKHLVEKLNVMIRKYQNIEQDNKRSLALEHKSSSLSSQQEDSILPFNFCGRVPKKAVHSQSQQKLNIRPTQKPQAGSLYVYPEQNFTLDYSIQSAQPSAGPNQQMRLFSHQNKTSLKQPLKFVRQGPKDLSFRSNDSSSKNSRNSSLNQHEHRFRFMMENLGQ